jgi:hypothetical protein
MELEHSRAIICEGPADEEFFKRLIKGRGLPDFDIVAAEGRGTFSQRLMGLRVRAQSRAVLIVSDNDDNPIRSFQDVQEQIRIATGYPIPERPMEVSKKAGQPTVMIMMLPWVDIPGCLETVLRSIWQREQESLKVCVDGFLECTNVTQWEIQKRDKAAIQCYIAGSNHEDPTKSLRWYLRKTQDIPIQMNSSELDDIANTLRDFDTVCGI